MFNEKSLLSFLKNRKTCIRCKGSGAILVKEASQFYQGVWEYYQQKCPECHPESK